MFMDTSVLQQELIELLLLLQHLNPAQVKDLCNFIQNNPPDGWFGQLQVAIQKSSQHQFEQLLALVSKPLDSDQQNGIRKELQSLANESAIPVKELEESFSLLYELHHLQNLLESLSILQLMKLFEAMPLVPVTQQRQLFLQIQQLLGSLQPDVLVNLQNQLAQSPGSEQQKLVEILNLPLDNFQLYQPLRSLLQLDLEELLKLQQELPKFNQIQSRELLQLLQLTPFDVIEFKKMLNPFESLGLSSEIMSDAQPPSISQTPMDFQSQTQTMVEKRIGLQIVEQPPEKSVYKRNLKPNPMVMVVGDQKVTGNLFVAVSLVRCDTLLEEPKFLTGNRPERVTTGRVVTFRKLKVTTTSHQQQETLFCLRFELRQYSNEEEFEVLDVLHSNPICVLSHSTQMKPVPTTAPIITDVIPGFGPPSGGTRVAVLGSSFVDSPAARIRFDTTDVMPIFHGPGTLICHTPQHTPGTVTVKVCNSNKKWSDTSATFTYDAALETFRDPMQESLVTRNFESMNEAAWQGNFDNVRRLAEGGSTVNSIDSRGFTPIHYASANGNLQVCSFLLEKGAKVNIQDKKGRTPLFWASAYGHDEIVQLLVDSGANINDCDFNGTTPLLASIAQGHEQSAFILLDHGASVNLTTFAGETPLHAAVSMGFDSLVKELIRYGAYVNAADEEEDTPLHWAVRERMYSTVQVLLSLGAFTDNLNSDMESPLHLALEIGEYPVADLLIRCGSAVNAYDCDGNTPLHLAALAGHVHIVQALLKNGANINAQNNYGDTPAHFAVQAAEFTFLDFLGKCGADYNKRNMYAETPLDVAPLVIKQQVQATLAHVLQQAPNPTPIGNELQCAEPRLYGRFGGVHVPLSVFN